MEVQDQIAAIWLPVAIALAFGIVGLIRGAARESIVAASVPLATLVVLQWSRQWGEVLHEFYSGISQADEQFGASIIVFWLIVLVLGYGLGAAVLPRQPLSAASRLGGALLGLASGAAVAGWSLRFTITNVDGTLAPGLFVDNPVSRGFMIWGIWFPVLLVFLAALMIIIGPVRRAQRRVATPSADSDWAPTARGAATATTPMWTQQAGSATPYTPPPAQAYDPGRTAPYTTQPGAPPTQQLPVRPAAPTMDLSPDGETRATHQLEATLPAGGADTNTDPGTYSASGQGTSPTSSWLLEPVTSEAEEQARHETDAAATTAPFATVSTGASESSTTRGGETAADGKKCANCGAVALPGALFCTECGSRLPA